MQKCLVGGRVIEIGPRFTEKYFNKRAKFELGHQGK